MIEDLIMIHHWKIVVELQKKISRTWIITNQSLNAKRGQFSSPQTGLL